MIQSVAPKRLSSTTEGSAFQKCKEDSFNCVL